MNQLIISISHTTKLPWYRRFWYWFRNKRLAWLSVMLKNRGIFSSPVHYTQSLIFTEIDQPFKSLEGVTSELMYEKGVPDGFLRVEVRELETDIDYDDPKEIEAITKLSEASLRDFLENEPDVYFLPTENMPTEKGKKLIRDYHKRVKK